MLLSFTFAQKKQNYEFKNIFQNSSSQRINKFS